MKKVLFLVASTLVLAACGSDEVKEVKSELKTQDERAKKSMDMSEGVKVYEIPQVYIGRPASESK